MPTTHRPPVMVGVDGVRGRFATVDLAVAEAVRRSAPLSIVHVWPSRYAGPFRISGRYPTEADGLHLLELAERRVRHTGTDLAVRTQLIDGEPASALVRCSAAAQLLVVGHRDDVLTRHGWGSTAAYLAHRAVCPLLVDRGTHQDKGPVVLAASARPSGTATVACAFEQASLRRAPLLAVHVWSAAPGSAGSTRSPVRAGYVAARDEADRTLAESLAGFSTQYPDVEVNRLVLHDLDLAYTLDRASSRGRLLVAGSGRHGRVAGMLYGSLDVSMLRTAACPVMLVPPGWTGSPANPGNHAPTDFVLP